MSNPFGYTEYVPDSLYGIDANEFDTDIEGFNFPGKIALLEMIAFHVSMKEIKARITTSASKIAYGSVVTPNGRGYSGDDIVAKVLASSHQESELKNIADGNQDYFTGIKKLLGKHCQDDPEHRVKGTYQREGERTPIYVNIRYGLIDQEAMPTEFDKPSHEIYDGLNDLETVASMSLLSLAYRFNKHSDALKILRTHVEEKFDDDHVIGGLINFLRSYVMKPGGLGNVFRNQGLMLDRFILGLYGKEKIEERSALLDSGPLPNLESGVQGTWDAQKGLSERKLSDAAMLKKLSGNGAQIINRKSQPLQVKEKRTLVTSDDASIKGLKAPVAKPMTPIKEDKAPLLTPGMPKPGPERKLDLSGKRPKIN